MLGMGMGVGMGVGASPAPGDPTMTLDFVNSNTLDPRVTFTRASAASYTDSSGTLQTAAADGPRFDYDPVTLTCKGLLIEEQRTNLLTYSSEFDNAAWTKSNATVTANAVAAPDGSLTADKLVENTVNGEHLLFAVASGLVSASTYTFTYFAKAAERTKSQILFAQGSNIVLAVVDLAAGTIAAPVVAGGAWTGAAASIELAGSGWYRVKLTATIVGSTAASCRLVLLNAAGDQIYTGDGTSGLFIWGAQLELGAFATSVIPTTTTALTRAVDVATMTGANFSNWYNQTEGTVYFEGGIPSDYSTGFPMLFSINDATTNNNIQPAINAVANVLNVEMKVAGSVVAGFYPAYTSGTTKLVFTYKLNDVNYAKDGVAGTTDTSAAIPAVTQMNLGATQAPSNFLNGHIARISYYPTRLANETLQAITS